jgi:3'-phosphoadenosine 5'-phosphosulfate sulfotransferase
MSNHETPSHETIVVSVSRVRAVRVRAPHESFASARARAIR